MTGVPKYRSSLDFAATYNGNKQGFAVSTDNFAHLKLESTAGVFVPPSVGTQGSSISDTGPSTDITASLNRNLKASVDGLTAVTANLSSVAGLNTGALIADALETALNLALSAAGYDARVWAKYNTGATQYEFYSQKTGGLSSVVITAAASLDLAVELKLGVANSGTEAAGTYGGDFLKTTKVDLKMAQPLAISEHKSGRQPKSIIKKKKMADGQLECYLNVFTGGTPGVDTPLDTLLTQALGYKPVNTSSEIRYDMSQAPNRYFSFVQGNNVFGRYFNGVYPKSVSVTLPGDGEAKMSFPMKAREGKYSGIAQIDGALVASSNVVVNAGESKRYLQNGTLVMVVDPDGRTILAGVDGTLSVTSRVDGSNQVNLSAPVTVADNGFLVPWLPHVLDQHGTDNPQTGLQGTVSFDDGATVIEEIRNVQIDLDPKTEDQDNWYGFDTNAGRTNPNRVEIKIKVDMLMTSAQVQHVVNALEFTPVAIKVVCGSASGRRVQWKFPKVYLQAPPIPIPDTGTVVASFEGIAVQSTDNANDAIQWSYL